MEKHYSIPHWWAVLFRFPGFLMCPTWYQRSDWYTWDRCIQSAASGEKGILPDLIQRHFFSAFSMKSRLYRSNLFNSHFSLLLEYCVCRTLSFLIKQCSAMFDSDLSTYFWVAPLETLVLCLLEVNRWFLNRATPTILDSWKSIMNIWWPPTPKPVGITHAWVTTRSFVAQTLSIGLLPLKNVCPIILPVNSPTTSCS